MIVQRPSRPRAGQCIWQTDDRHVETIDYSKTLYLPQTDFPMRAGLPEKEPLLVKRWQDMDLYTRCAKGRRAAKNTCCMTARPTPTATSISAMR